VSASNDNPIPADVRADGIGNASAPCETTLDNLRFCILADASPDIFGRVANLFAVANLAPQAASIERVGCDQLQFRIEFCAINLKTADYIKRKIEQLTLVSSVEISRTG
jgi:hypothetical protein